jgi:hypothetical protein
MRHAWLCTLALCACSNGSSATTPSQRGDASLTEIVPGDDASVASVDAGPLWRACSPANPASCPAGFECFPSHTSPIDAIDTCVFACADGGETQCLASGGTCACGMAPNGAPGDCSLGNDGGYVTVCVPAGDAGPSGDNVGDASLPVLPDASDEGGLADAGPG